MMTNHELFKAMFHRKSIRKYDMTPLDQAKLEDIKKFAANVKPLDEKIKYELVYLGGDDVKTIISAKAPHHICIYSEVKNNYLMNAGFILQQIDLYLSFNDLGSCWLGMAKPSKDIPKEKDGLEFVVMLALGKANEPVHRVNSSEFKRKTISEISQIANINEFLEGVRLAPSAINSQPWVFSGNEDEIIVSREKLNLIKAPIYNRTNQIDIGIALCHLWLSLDQEGKSVEFDFNKVPAPNGYEFMAKVKVKN